MSRLVRESVRERAHHFNIILDDVSITHLKFGPEFTHAVESKQIGIILISSLLTTRCSDLFCIAQQEAQRAAFEVEKAKQDKQSIIVRAQGEAQSAELIGKSIMNNPGFLELRRLENAREIARVVSDSKNRVFLNADTLLLNVQET